MTREEIARAFQALPPDDKRAVAEEIMREYCRAPGGSFTEMMGLCSSKMGRGFPFRFSAAERTGERS